MSSKIFPGQKSGIMASSSLQSIGVLSRQQSSTLDSKLRKQLADSIGVEEEEEELTFEKMRIETKNFFTNTLFGELYNNLLLILSVFSCIQHIQQTYDKDPPTKDVLELSLAILFTLDWCLCFFIADLKIFFISR